MTEDVFVELTKGDNQLAEFLQGLRNSTIGYSEDCKERVLRRTLIRADDNPNGIAAAIVRWKMDSYLPEQAKTREIKNALIRVAAYAAANDDMWRLVYPREKEQSDPSNINDV